MKKWILGSALVAAAALLTVPTASLYVESGNGRRCTGCHEMQPLYDGWAGSTHRAISCSKCHGSALTTDVSFHMDNVHRAYAHWRGDLPERITFPNRDVDEMTAQCQSCHRQEYAAWKAGGHSATYERIFLDKKHTPQTC
ncbi:MAG: NapC/NirT family cytochrome c [Ignavibacteriota bacterium]